MKVVIRVVVAMTVAGVVALFMLPFLVAAGLAGQLQASSQLAAGWDIPPEVVPMLRDAGQQGGVPWYLLAAVASVATDFARHAPDGVARGSVPGTAIDPVVTPPITASGGGAGMFLVDAPQAGPDLPSPQDVRAAAAWLAARLAALAEGRSAPPGPLGDAAVSQFWQSVLAAAPLVITSVAPSGANSTPVDPGGNPIRQFGAAVMAQIGAPVTSVNLDAFAAWAAGEGSCAQYNPLATTQPEPGATPFNNLSGGGHVWNYPSFATGVTATTTAMTNGLYQPVLAALRASAGVGAVAGAVEQSPWGTRHFGSPSYGGPQCGGNPPAAPVPTLPTVAGPAGVVATIVARAAVYETIWSQMVALAPTAASSTP